MAFATNDGVNLHYDVVGPPGGGVVAFVEGVSFGDWMWRWQRPAVADAFRTVVWDNRGTGQSDTPEGPYTATEMATDMEAVLDDAGVDAAHFVGASLGGMVALEYALDFDRVESLSLLCTGPGGEDAEPIPEATRDQMLHVPDGLDSAERIRYRMRPAFTDEFRAEHPDVIDRIVDWRLETDPTDQAYEWQAAAAATFDVSDRLDDIDCPAVVLHGTEDRVVPVENGRLLADGVPDARFEPVEGGSHLFFVEQADRVNDVLMDFLGDV